MGICKSESRHRPENCTPVSLTWVLCKCPERIIRKQICEQLVNHSANSGAQRRFMVGMSSQANLLLSLYKVVEGLDEDQWFAVCCMNLSKALDSVNRSCLERKMKAVRITGRANIWVNSFLRRMTFSVRVRRYMTVLAGTSGGVSQGSV